MKSRPRTTPSRRVAALSLLVAGVMVTSGVAVAPAQAAGLEPVPQQLTDLVKDGHGMVRTEFGDVPERVGNVALLGTTAIFSTQRVEGGNLVQRLWSRTAAGTAPVDLGLAVRFAPGAGGIGEVRALGSRALILVNGMGGNPASVWVSDGTPAGTVKVEEADSVAPVPRWGTDRAYYQRRAGRALDVVQIDLGSHRRATVATLPSSGAQPLGPLQFGFLHREVGGGQVRLVHTTPDGDAGTVASAPTSAADGPELMDIVGGYAWISQSERLLIFNGVGRPRVAGTFPRETSAGLHSPSGDGTRPVWWTHTRETTEIRGDEWYVDTYYVHDVTRPAGQEVGSRRTQHPGLTANAVVAGGRMLLARTDPRFPTEFVSVPPVAGAAVAFFWLDFLGKGLGAPVDMHVRGDGTVLIPYTGAGNGRGLWAVRPDNVRSRVTQAVPVPGSFVDVGSRTFFTADGLGMGAELFVTNSTYAGTRPVADLAPGSASSNPSGLVTDGGSLWFTASAPKGRELYGLGVRWSALRDSSVLGARFPRAKPQRLPKSVWVKVPVAAGQDVRVKVTGSIKVPGRKTVKLKSVSTTLRAGQPLTVKLKAPASKRATVRAGVAQYRTSPKRLKSKRKVVATVKVAMRDAAGDRVTKKIRIRLQ